MDYNSTGLLGRFVADPVLSETPSGISVITFRLANERGFGENKRTNFINCVAFGKTAEFIEKYFNKGMAIGITGRIQTGSYTNKDGQKVYTTDVVLDDIEFAESKNAQGGDNGGNYSYSAPARPEPSAAGDGFMNIPDGIDEELPFN